MTLWPLLLLPLAGAPADQIIFDTDCGYFGDDGSALVMVLRSPDKVRVAEITAVSGNVWAAESAGYLKEILGLLGHPEMKVSVGAQMPFTHTAELAKLEGPLEFEGAFARPRKLTPAGQAEAIGELAAVIGQHPGQITILALGPMTNVAILLRLHPDLETKIKRIVFMGGNVHVPGNASGAAEFNFWFDPEAAQMVMRSRIPEKVMFPLDICNRAVLNREQFDAIVAAKTPITERYKEDFGRRYPGFLKNPKATGYLWDELAAAWLLDTGFVTKAEKSWLDVETRFGKSYGATVALDRKLAPDATPVDVKLDLDLARFSKLYQRLLTAR
ncbi:MAG TPA: nucleoside hydrolase [Bryobacteraceae bacterium]|nr:nucleoside hydrolase [Bryobacteraceae bacterium]